MALTSVWAGSTDLASHLGGREISSLGQEDVFLLGVVLHRTVLAGVGSIERGLRGRR